jgi:hypothetical protein
MRGLSDEIAVLDGLDALPGYQSRVNVIDPSEGANYGGGSDYYPGSPLVTSNSGLAGADDDLMRGYMSRTNVIDPSEGANYGGGSDYYPGGPLTPSNAGLAGCYEGCGLNDIDRAYGSTMEAAPVSSPNYRSRVNVIDPSEGANYTGGSDYSPGMPLITSNSGLAGLDAVSDKFFAKRLFANQRPAFKRLASKVRIEDLKSRYAHLKAARARGWKTTPQQDAYFRSIQNALLQARTLRANIIRKNRN